MFSEDVYNGSDVEVVDSEVVANAKRHVYSNYRTPRAQFEQENLELFLEIKPTDNAALVLGQSVVYSGVRHSLALIARAALGFGAIKIANVESLGGLKTCTVVYRPEKMDHPSMYVSKADRNKAEHF